MSNICVTQHKRKTLTVAHRDAIGKSQYGIAKPRINGKGAGLVCDSSSSELESRISARELGELYYWVNEPCNKGHLAERRVKTGMCRTCESEIGITNYRKRVLEDLTFIAYNMAKIRAKKKNIPFSITRDDVRAVYPKDGVCPVLGIPLINNLGTMGSTAQSPTLDKLIPSRGYVVGNIGIISHKANTLKSDEHRIEVFEQMVEWLSGNRPQQLGYQIDNTYVKNKLNAARRRAVKEHIPFNLTIDDIQKAWPSNNSCPILKVPLLIGDNIHGMASPTLDKFNPELGYVPGNVAIISYKANLMKQRETTSDNFIKIIKWLNSATAAKQFVTDEFRR